MTFLNLAALTGLAAISIPIIIHLLNQFQVKEVTWAAMRFLQESIEKNQRRLQLEDILLLILRCLLIALLIFALSRPTWMSGEHTTGAHQVAAVIIIDDSYSMGLTNGITTSFQRAQTAAEQILAAFQATQPTRIGTALSDVARMTKARGIIIVISDLFDDELEFEKGIQQFRFGGSEVIVFHVLDPYELEFPFEGTVDFIGLEGTNRLKTNPQGIRKSYLDAFTAFCKRMQAICDRAGCHYILANTKLPLAETLSSYLAFRHKVAAR